MAVARRPAWSAFGQHVKWRVRQAKPSNGLKTASTGNATSLLQQVTCAKDASRHSPVTQRRHLLSAVADGAKPLYDSWLMPAMPWMRAHSTHRSGTRGPARTQLPGCGVSRGGGGMQCQPPPGVGLCRDQQARRPPS